MLALTIIATIGLLSLCILSIIMAKQDRDCVFYAIIITINSATILLHYLWRCYLSC